MPRSPGELGWTARSDWNLKYCTLCHYASLFTLEISLRGTRYNDWGKYFTLVTKDVAFKFTINLLIATEFGIYHYRNKNDSRSSGCEEFRENIYEKHLISVSWMKNCYWNRVDWTGDPYNYVVLDATLMKIRLITNTLSMKCYGMRDSAVCICYYYLFMFR